MRVTIEEEPRVFLVRVGENNIGKVTSYHEEGDDNDENYHAELYTDEDNDKDLGYHATLEEAGKVVVDWAYGPAKINKVVERIV